MSNPRNINQLLQGAANSQAAQLPGIPAIQVQDRALADVLRAFKERLEVREGERGNPFESVVTRRELDELGIVRTAPSPCRVTDLAGITGQTKAGEFVQVELTDLADAVKAASGGTTQSVSDAKKESDALKAEIAALAAKVAAFGDSGATLLAIKQLEAVMNAKSAVYDAAIETATQKIAQYDAAVNAANLKFADYDGLVAAATAKFNEYDRLVSEGTGAINNIVSGVTVMSLNPGTTLRSAPMVPGWREWEWHPTVDVLIERVRDHDYRLAAHGI